MAIAVMATAMATGTATAEIAVRVGGAAVSATLALHAPAAERPRREHGYFLDRCQWRGAASSVATDTRLCRRELGGLRPRCATPFREFA